MRVGSLFAGIGGFDLAARWMGWTTEWFSEIDPYASAVLAKHWPGVPNHGDIRQIDGGKVATIDLLCGGFPCQDISLAGRGGGLAGERSGLWFEYARVIEEAAPRWVVIENVPALRSRGLDRVLGSLTEIGYDAEWHCIPAAYIGAPHRRDRIWIVAYPNGQLAQPDRAVGYVGTTAGQDQRESQERERVRNAVDHRGAYVAPPHEPGPQGRIGGILQERATERVAWASGSSSRDHQWWLTEPDVGRVANGVPSRVDRLKCLGNALVPQVAYMIFRAIAEADGAR